MYCNVLFCNHPSTSSLFKHLGMYVYKINLYHIPHLPAVIAPCISAGPEGSNSVEIA